MEEQIQAIRESAGGAIQKAATLQELRDLHARLLGRNGEISGLSAGMREVSKEDRPRMGQLLNQVRGEVTAALEARELELREQADLAALGALDISLPGQAAPAGTLHPITLLSHRAITIFRRMGFALADGPDIETEWHCFDALNTPADHPARNESDTFYLPDGRLLRTHTSTVQIRTMETEPPPIRIVAPGSAFRRDETDATHSPQFTQMEGLYVDEDVSLGDLKGTLEFFFRELLGEETEVRLRPHYFPFTEPSYEIDVRMGSGADAKWIEIAGCGMVDPAVFECVCQRRGDSRYDPEKVSGFAFGFGLDRLAMNLWGIGDIRLFGENDLRFLEQFSMGGDL